METMPELNWTELLESARRSRAELPLRVALDYMARELHAPVPDAVRARLAAATETVDPVERDVALLTARRRGGMRLRALLGGTATIRVKLTSLRWLVLPSRGYFEWAYGTPRAVSLPLAHLERVGRYLARRASWLFRRTKAATRPGAVRGTGR
jgi:hypothetical protein